VVALTRTPAKAGALRALGALPVVVDALDREAVHGAVLGAEPEVIVHQMTALAGTTDLRRFDRTFALTNRLRTEGTRHLLDAGRAAGTRRLIAQSFTGWPFARTGGPVKDEDAPLDDAPPRAQKETLAAIRALEAMVSRAEAERGVEGVVLRYGGLYGPGTSLSADGEVTQLVRKRRLPVVGGGEGRSSFTHVDDAAGGVLATLDGPQGVFAIVDDEPARAADWIPALADAVGAPAPRHVPRWVGRLAAGEVGATMMTSTRGASNERAHDVLGWRPRWPSWREGFRHAL
jgi:nucleoside-diphosphate-sugar epimerase